MAPPPQIAQWLRRTYPKPQVDPEWLEGCYSWIESEFNLNPTTQLDEILRHVDNQLLESDLQDSMITGTGLPQNLADLGNTVLRGPILVQITAITEIGHSAFSLQNVRQARLERADMAGLAGGDDDDEEGPIPRYPRSMLRFQLSDGSTILQAIEHRRLPELELGETPLGYKMILKDVCVRKGLAFLEPKSVIMKGHQNADLNAMQDRDFARSLRLRLGLPDDPAEHAPAPEAVAPAADAAPAVDPAAGAAQGDPRPEAAAARAQVAQMTSVRSPLRELSDPPSPLAAGPSRPSHDDDAGQPRRRKLPSRAGRSPSPTPPPRTANRPGTQTHSRYFSPGASSHGAYVRNPSADLARERLFSPHRQPPVVVPDSDEDEFDTPSATLVSAKPPRGTAMSTNAPSDEFDFESDFADDSFLEQVDRMEREALGLNAGPTQVTQTTVATSTLVGTSASATQRTSVQSSNEASGSGSGSRSGPSTAGSSRIGAAQGEGGSAAMDRVDLDVIAIDDSEEDDKENVPVPTRHVRRRIASLDAEADEVIILSD
ncbi:hypothetical protein AcW1_008360 [Taiwanofungus camphoratus]|nr:hypothetical protein AcW1_008360 [Antrodia cinnamomea]KAI0956183.1 hypothetical protein AcV7_006645 [Antrodia cinnamomea]